MRRDASWITPVALLAALFGAATVWSGGRVLFGGPAAQAAAGDAIPAILWFNFVAGAVYIAAAAALYLRHPAARPLAWMIGLATLGMFALLLALAATGTPFEWRTVGAMILRAAFWLGIALALGPPRSAGRTG